MALVRIIVVGAGGFGRELLQYAGDAIAAGRLDGEIAGFLDDGRSDPAAFGLEIPVLGDPMDYAPRANDRFVVAVGEPADRARLAGRLADAGGAFVSIVHPTAYVAPTARVGAGCVLCPLCFVGAFAAIADHAVVNAHASLGHDARLGRAAVLSPHASCGGGAFIGEEALLGSGAILLPGQSVGARARVAPGAVVYGPVPDGAMAMGNPARSGRIGAPGE
nr:acetyltransferase [Azospirillum sp. 412522]